VDFLAKSLVATMGQENVV